MAAIFDPLGVRRRFDDQPLANDDLSFFEQGDRGVPDGPAAFRNPPLGPFLNQSVIPQGPREVLQGSLDGDIPRDLVRTLLLRPGESLLENLDKIDPRPFVPGELQLRKVLLGNGDIRDIDPGLVRPVPKAFDDPGLIRQLGADFIDPTFARPLPTRGDEDRFHLPVGADGRIDQRRLSPGQRFALSSDGTEWRYNGDKFVKQSSARRRLLTSQRKNRAFPLNASDMALGETRDQSAGGEVNAFNPSKEPALSFDENDPEFMSQFPPGVDPRTEAQKISTELQKERRKPRIETLSETMSDTLSDVARDALAEGKRIGTDILTDMVSPLQPLLGKTDPLSERHTHRNIHNRCPKSPPKPGGGPEAPLIDCQGNIWESDDDVGDFHGGSQGNRTFRAPDPRSEQGGFQCTYTEEGKLVDEGPFMGTYDYVAPDIDLLSHAVEDVVTHKKNPNYAPDLTQVYCR